MTPLTVSQLLNELIRLENAGHKNKPVYVVQASESTTDGPFGNAVVAVKFFSKIMASDASDSNSYERDAVVAIIDGAQ